MEDNECPICIQNYNKNQQYPLKVYCCQITICTNCIESIIKTGSALCPWCKLRWTGRNVLKNCRENTPKNYYEFLQEKSKNNTQFKQLTNSLGDGVLREDYQKAKEDLKREHSAQIEEDIKLAQLLHEQERQELDRERQIIQENATAKKISNSADIPSKYFKNQCISLNSTNDTNKNSNIDVLEELIQGENSSQKNKKPRNDLTLNSNVFKANSKSIGKDGSESSDEMEYSTANELSPTEMSSSTYPSFVTSSTLLARSKLSSSSTSSIMSSATSREGELSSSSSSISKVDNKNKFNPQFQPDILVKQKIKVQRQRQQSIREVYDLSGNDSIPSSSITSTSISSSSSYPKNQSNIILSNQKDISSSSTSSSTLPILSDRYFIIHKKWNCSVCTFANYHLLRVCEICDTKRI